MRLSLHQLAKSALGSPTLQQSFISTFGNLFSGVVAAIAMIIASRILEPKEFGIFSVFASLIAIFSKFGDLGLNATIVRFFGRWQETERARSVRLLQSTMAWRIRGLVVGSGIIALLATFFLADSLEISNPGLWILVIIGSAILAFYELTYVLFSSLQRFLLIGVLGTVLALTKILGFSFFFFLTHPLIGISAIYALSPIAAITSLYRFLPEKTFTLSTTVAKDIQGYISTYSPHAFVGVICSTLIANIDILFVQSFLGSYDAGMYAAASRIALFISFLTVAVGGVLNSRVSHYQDKSLQLRYLKKSVAVVGFAILGFVLFLPVARLSILFTVGESYLPALPILMVLAANAFLALAIAPLSALFYAVEAPKYFSLSGVLQVSLICILNLLLLSHSGIMVAAMSRLLATASFGIFTILYLYRKLR
jgi:O-antigen/teichoic acid export membrane protein